MTGLLFESPARLPADAVIIYLHHLPASVNRQCPTPFTRRWNLRALNRWSSDTSKGGRWDENEDGCECECGMRTWARRPTRFRTSVPGQIGDGDGWGPTGVPVSAPCFRAHINLSLAL